jgi:hypothetical protein
MIQGLAKVYGLVFELMVEVAKEELNREYSS